MLLSVTGLYHSYADAEVLRDVSFSVEDADRVGVVGDNGCGKTTLLELVCGDLEVQKGNIALRDGAAIGYLRQSSGLRGDGTVMEEMKSIGGADAVLARMKTLERELAHDSSLMDEYASLCARYDALDGYNLDFNIRRVLRGLDFGEEKYDEPVASLSGGEKTRLAMAKLLVSSPELIALDEPTNHLDLRTTDWLAGFLSEYPGAVMVVSHDGSFLDRVCNKTLEIEDHRAQMYGAGYSVYRELKKSAQDAAEKKYRQDTRRAKELEDYVARNLVRASTTKMAQSRRKMLDRMELAPPEEHSHEKIFFRFKEPPQPYKELLRLKGLTIGVEGTALFRAQDFLLLRGENLAVMGGNGTGKTTFLRTLLHRAPPIAGRAVFGGGVRLGYFEQNVFTDEKRSAMEYIWDYYPSMKPQEIRDLLASVGLRGDEVFLPVNELSGGERARLAVCRLSLQVPNVLLLDEPTNHLDVYSRDVLCDTLAAFPGTVIAVTHDRELALRLGCRILYIEDGTGKIYESVEALPLGEKPSADKKERQLRESGSQKEQRRQSAALRARRAELDKEVSELEARVNELEVRISLPEVATDAEKLTGLCAELTETKKKLDAASDEWLALSE